MLSATKVTTWLRALCAIPEVTRKLSSIIRSPCFAICLPIFTENWAVLAPASTPLLSAWFTMEAANLSFEIALVSAATAFSEARTCLPTLPATFCSLAIAGVTFKNAFLLRELKIAVTLPANPGASPSGGPNDSMSHWTRSWSLDKCSALCAITSTSGTIEMGDQLLLSRMVKSTLASCNAWQTWRCPLDTAANAAFRPCSSTAAISAFL
mmetsp:Transcript_25669/g.66012  ORF Transcript_25669/g.66012 Transcript_25669/m.66012 type:complete len:210 (-) Transcript_25669:1615-2244(-)